MKNSLMTLLMLFSSSIALALEAQNPVTLCERFVTPLEKANCEDQMKKLLPDWYLASLCAKQFEDKAFYQCMNLSKLSQFSPKKLSECDAKENTDEGRMSCIQGTVVSKAEAYQRPTATPRTRRGSMRLSEGF